MQTVIPPSFTLSDESLNQLRVLVIEEIGPEKAATFSKQDLHDFGIFLLTVSALSLEIQHMEKNGLLHG